MIKRIVFGIGVVWGMLVGVSPGWGNEELPQSGIARSFYQSGALLSEETIQNGKREGTFNTFYESGALQAIGQYRNDLEEGIFYKYYENGMLMLEVEYEEGQMNGLIRFYSKKGMLIRQWDSSQYKSEESRFAFDPDRPFDVSAIASQRKFYSFTTTSSGRESEQEKQPE